MKSEASNGEVRRINSALDARLTSTFRLCLKHALQHALLARPGPNDILQTIVNIQTATELLSKLYVLRRIGWIGIVDKSFHNVPKAKVLKSIENGSIRTKPHWENWQYVKQHIHTDDEDKRLISNFQRLRNQVVHLGLLKPSKSSLHEAISFVVRIVHQLDWHAALPHREEYFSNSLRVVLGPTIYNKLIGNSPYCSSAKQRAHELFDDVGFCFECGNEAWIEDFAPDVRTCLVCGYKAPSDALGFVDCPKCRKSRSVVYDVLNVDANPKVPGLCCACRHKTFVARCRACGCDHIYGKQCGLCA